MLKTRIITALALVAVFVPTLFFLPLIAWQLITLVACLVALYEWTQFFEASAKFKQCYLGLAGVFGLSMISIFFIKQHLPSNLVIAMLLFVFALGAILPSLFWMFISPWFLGKKWQLRNRFVMAALGYVLLGGLWFALAELQSYPQVLLGVIATIAISDSAAYFAGKNFGKRKLAPNISPGKTWEGVAGAFVAVSLFAGVLMAFTQAPWQILPLLWLLTALGIIGDLFESLLKRQHGLKDSGNVLPGHGGVLDRIDALMPALPATLLVMVILMTLSKGGH